MRKITILIATCILFIMPSCTKSNEDKAEELISKCIKENMSYPDSYEAISTKVDSSFVKVSTIIEILDLSEDVFSDISKIRAIKSDISSAQTTKDCFNNNLEIGCGSMTLAPHISRMCLEKTLGMTGFDSV